jgi:hypothetical protein
MASPVTVGTPAPDLVYRTLAGEERHLSDTWKQRPALILWLRHCG